MPRDLGPDLEAEVGHGPRPQRDAFAPLRVWLEPGWDGRIAGWVEGVPGALAVAETRERVLSDALTVTGRVREWLEAHGDEVAVPRISRSVAAGEVPTVLESDGYEVMATLPSDLRPVGVEEVDTALRRLSWARADLVTVLDAISAWEARTGGALPCDAARGERTPAEVARHSAGAEVWMTGRLRGAGRYEGSLDDGPMAEVLAASRAWVAERLGALARVDDGEAVSDRHGETWTLAKVLRRLQGHAFDHLWELQRRLVRADGTRDRIAIRLDVTPDTGAVIGLFRSVGWDMRASEPASVEKAIGGTSEFATAWDGDRLIGTARSITDGGQNGLIATVVVHPAYQGLGVGERLVNLLIDEWDQVRFSLTAAPGLEGWYRKLGFVPDPHAMYRPRRRQ